MSDHGKLDALLEQYWNAAYAEGAAGLTHDTADLVAQLTLNSIYAEVEKQLAERDAALARFSSILSSIANAVEKEAFRMRAPNEHTPVFVGIANFARNNNCGIPASAQATAKVLETCRWVRDVVATDDVWNTECGEMFVLNDGTPKQNGMVFCPYCGKAIREEKETK